VERGGLQPCDDTGRCVKWGAPPGAGSCLPPGPVVWRAGPSPRQRRRTDAAASPRVVAEAVAIRSGCESGAARASCIALGDVAASRAARVVRRCRHQPPPPSHHTTACLPLRPYGPAARSLLTDAQSASTRRCPWLIIALPTSPACCVYPYLLPSPPTSPSPRAGHGRWVWDCVYSADSSYLVTASSDMLSKLWEVGTGEVVRTYSGHSKAVTAVALNDAAPVPSAGTAAPHPAPAPPASTAGAGAGGPAPAAGGEGRR
jgi:hypothetical protein